MNSGHQPNLMGVTILMCVYLCTFTFVLLTCYGGAHTQTCSLSLSRPPPVLQSGVAIMMCTLVTYRPRLPPRTAQFDLLALRPLQARGGLSGRLQGLRMLCFRSTAVRISIIQFLVFQYVSPGLFSIRNATTKLIMFFLIFFNKCHSNPAIAGSYLDCLRLVLSFFITEFMKIDTAKDGQLYGK